MTQMKYTVTSFKPYFYVFNFSLIHLAHFFHHTDKHHCVV